MNRVGAFPGDVAADVTGQDVRSPQEEERSRSREHYDDSLTRKFTNGGEDAAAGASSAIFDEHSMSHCF